LGAMIGIAASISGMYISYFFQFLVQQLSSRVSLVYVGVTIQPSQGILLIHSPILVGYRCGKS